MRAATSGAAARRFGLADAEDGGAGGADLVRLGGFGRAEADVAGGAERGTGERVGHGPVGLIDREFHEVYALEWDEPLSSYEPDPHEVSGLAAVSAQELLELVSGQREWLRAVEPSGTVVRRDGLVPYSLARLGRLLARNLHPTEIVGITESLH